MLTLFGMEVGIIDYLLALRLPDHKYKAKRKSQIIKNKYERKMEDHWKDYYQILQVHLCAEQEIITAAYRKLADKYHPDHNRTLGRKRGRMRNSRESMKRKNGRV